MATAKNVKKPKASNSSKQPKKALPLSALIAEAAEIKAKVTKLLDDLRACKAAGGDNAYGGDLPTVKGVKKTADGGP